MTPVNDGERERERRGGGEEEEREHALSYPHLLVLP